MKQETLIAMENDARNLADASGMLAEVAQAECGIGEPEAGIAEAEFADLPAEEDDPLLGYFPLRLFIGISLATLGVYPYLWLWDNAGGLARIGDGRTGKQSLRCLAVLGLCVQAVLLLSICAFLFDLVVGSYYAAILGGRLLTMFFAFYLFLVFPIRCFYYYDLRWSIRSMVAKWDKDAVIIDRTVGSWAGLALLGSPYLQYHINRLMGLGMSGFAKEELGQDGYGFRNWLRDYIRVEKMERNAERMDKRA